MRFLYVVIVVVMISDSRLTIEVVDEQSKLDPLLTQIKRRVGDNGLVTIQEVYGL